MIDYVHPNGRFMDKLDGMRVGTIFTYLEGLESLDTYVVIAERTFRRTYDTVAFGRRGLFPWTGENEKWWNEQTIIVLEFEPDLSKVK